MQNQITANQKAVISNMDALRIIQGLSKFSEEIGSNMNTLLEENIGKLQEAESKIKDLESKIAELENTKGTVAEIIEN